MTDHAKRWSAPPHRLPLRGQENNYPIAAEDEVGGGFLCGIALAGDHAKRWSVPPHRLPLRGQENNYPIAAEDEVGGGFLCGIALAGDHAAVDYRPAVVLR